MSNNLKANYQGRAKLEQIEARLNDPNFAHIPSLSYDAQWLIAEVRKLRQALEPFATLTQFEVNEKYGLAGRILAADILRARKALEED